MSTPTHTLRKKIRAMVVAADGLSKRDLFRLPDPFAVITVDEEQTHTTSVVKKTLNPYWNESFYITVKYSSVVAVQIFDQKKFKRRDQGFLGVVSVKVGDVLDLELGGHEMLTLDLKGSSVVGKLIIYLSTNVKQPMINPGPPTSALADMGMNESSISLSPTSVTTAIAQQRNFNPNVDQYGALPPGWERRIDPLGRTYYLDHNTRTVTWDRPSPNQNVNHSNQDSETNAARDQHSRRILADDVVDITTSGAPSGTFRNSSTSVQPASHNVPPPVVGSSGNATTAGSGSLPAGWKEPEGRPYWVDHNTRTTTEELLSILDDTTPTQSPAYLRDSHQLPTGFFDDESSATLGTHYQQQQDVTPPAITPAEDAQESSQQSSAYSLQDLTNRIQGRSSYPIASGGFGDIWKCILVNPNEVVQVAVKTIRTFELDDDASMRTNSRRVRRELKVWGRLKHDCILPLWGVASGFGPYPAMICPWVLNGALTGFLERQQDILSSQDKFSLLNDIALGLQYLHSKSIIHGDLTGSNVLVQENGRACLADFGLSTMVLGFTNPSYFTSSIKGNIRWAAAELFEVPDDDDDDEGNTAASLSIECDVYSFGSIALQVLTCKVPYYNVKKDTVVLGQVLRGKKPEPPKDSHIAPLHWEFIQRCWLSRACRPTVGDIVAFVARERFDLVFLSDVEYHDI